MFRIESRRLATPLVLSVAVASALTLGSTRAGSGTTREPGGSTRVAAALNGEIDQVSPPCHPNPMPQRDIASVSVRGDVRSLPQPLRQRLLRLAGRPHSTLPIQAFAEADQPSRLFQYYLVDTHNFEPNVFTAIFPGVNDAVQLTATGPTAACRRSGRSALSSSRSPTYRRIRTTFAPSSTCSPTFIPSSSSTTRAAGTRAG